MRVGQVGGHEEPEGVVVADVLVSDLNGEVVALFDDLLQQNWVK